MGEQSSLRCIVLDSYHPLHQTTLPMSNCDVCGWLAAVASAVAFGTFGVPIKSDAAVSVDIDPLVFQSYKTFMCFCTAWLVLVFGESFEFTPWGIVSAIFWVPGGVATVYAIKAAGLAIGIGIGSSFIVLVSFFWGIFVFQEHVHSVSGACFAVFCLILGLMGMSYYSSPVETSDEEVMGEYNGLVTDDEGAVEAEPADGPALEGEKEEDDSGLREIHSTTSEDRAEDDALDTASLPTRHLPSFYDDAATDTRDGISTGNTSYEQDGIILQEMNLDDEEVEHVIICGIKIHRRHLGMMAAAFCGIWGGSIMAPMKWCKSDTKGTHYLLSFAIGAAIVTMALWLFRYTINIIHYKGDCVAAYEALPSFHLRVMWKAGGLSGLLWSIGNFFSLISVFYLGEGVGYPLVQSSILVSGVWGIFYFGEVQGHDRITMWILSSLFTLLGILLLSYEHHEQ